MSADLALHRRDACFSRVAHTEEDENEDNETSFGERRFMQSVSFVRK